MVNPQQNKTSIEVIKSQFKDHDRHHVSIENKLDVLDRCLQRLMTNHLPHLKEEIIQVQSDVKWHAKIGGAIGGIAGSIVTSGIILFLEYLTK